MKSRKGQVFSFLLLFGVSAILMGAFWYIGNKKTTLSCNPDVKEFGAKQQLIFKVFQAADEKHFYWWMEAREMWKNPVFEMAEFGGFGTWAVNRCRKDGEIYFWNTNKTDWCLDREKVTNNFKEGLLLSLKNQKWVQGDYTFFVTDGQFVMTNNETSWFEDLEIVDIDYVYQQKFDFAVEMDYNFSEYDQLLEVSHKLVDECSDAVDLIKCVDDNKKGLPFEKEISGVDNCDAIKRECVFNILSNYSIWHQGETAYNKAPVEYWFGLKFIPD